MARLTGSVCVGHSMAQQYCWNAFKVELLGISINVSPEPANAFIDVEPLSPKYICDR